MQLVKIGRNHFLVLFIMFFAYAFGVVWWVHLDTSPPLMDQSSILRQSLTHYVLLTERPAFEAIRGILTGFYFYPPLVPLNAALFYLFFGPDSHVAVLSTLLFLAVLFSSVYLLGSFLSGKGAGLFAVFLAATSPMIIGYSKEFWLEVPVTGMLMAFLYFLVRSKNLEDTGYSIGLGIICGLGMLTKWSFAFFAVGPMAITLWLIFKDTWLTWKKRLLVGSLVSLTFILGIFVYWLLPPEARIMAKMVILITVFFVGVAILPPIFGRIKPLISERVLGLFQISKTSSEAWLNLLIVVTIALIIAGPWYLTNSSELRSGFQTYGIDVAVKEGDPPSLSIPCLMYGFWNILNSQLFLPFGLLAFIGLFWVLWTKSSNRDWGLLIAYFVIGYLILTIIPNKSHRYTLPLLPVALISGSAWAFNQRAAIRHTLIIAAVVVGLIQYFAIDYGYAWVDRTVSIPLPSSTFTEYRGLPPQIVIYSTAEKMFTDLDAYYSHPPLNEQWPLEPILEAVKNDSTSPNPSLVVATYADERFLNYGALWYVAMLRRWPIKVSWIGGFISSPEKWDGIHYLLVKTGSPVRGEVKNMLSGNFSFLEVRTLKIWNLPDGSQVELLRIEATGLLNLGELRGEIP